jgi:TRAP-type mannitol/chloroaromatic compound transport system permease small subunit
VQRLFDVLSTFFICVFSAAIVFGGSKEAWDKLMRWETFGTAWDPPIPAVMKPLILLCVTLIAVQSVANLIADWKHGKETHDLTEDVAAEFEDLLEEKKR